MKKIIYSLIAFAALNSISMNAMAEWTIVDKNDETTVYADKNTIYTHGNLVKMATLDDLVMPTKFRGAYYASIKWVEDYDCIKGVHRILSSVFYEQHMGGGEIVVSFGTTQGWDAVQPNSTTEKLWKLACGAKF